LFLLLRITEIERLQAIDLSLSEQSLSTSVYSLKMSTKKRVNSFAYRVL